MMLIRVLLSSIIVLFSYVVQRCAVLCGHEVMHKFSFFVEHSLVDSHLTQIR